MLVVKACCTNCSIETHSASEPLPAVQRWGTVRVKNAERFASNLNIPLYLLTARDGLLGKDDLVPSGGVQLSDQEISRKAHRVASQLKDKNIRELNFLVTASNRLAIAYLRLITLACDRAKVSLEVLDHRGRPFAEWSNVFRQAEETRKRASKPEVSVREVFGDLFRRYGEEDGMIWFKRGEAHRARQLYAYALYDFRQSAQLFSMKEWRDAANSQVKLVGKYIPRAQSLSAAIQNELEKIDRLALDADVKTLSREALRVVSESPSASVLLSFAAMERILAAMERNNLRLDRLPLTLWEQIRKLKPLRNEIAHGPLIADPGHAASFKNLLLDLLEFAHNLHVRR
jgi:hypothetical protein